MKIATELPGHPTPLFARSTDPRELTLRVLAAYQFRDRVKFRAAMNWLIVGRPNIACSIALRQIAFIAGSTAAESVGLRESSQVSAGYAERMLTVPVLSTALTVGAIATAWLNGIRFDVTNVECEVKFTNGLKDRALFARWLHGLPPGMSTVISATF